MESGRKRDARRRDARDWWLVGWWVVGGDCNVVGDGIGLVVGFWLLTNRRYIIILIYFLLFFIFYLLTIKVLASIRNIMWHPPFMCVTPIC